MAVGRNHCMTADPCATRGAVHTVFHTGFGACSRCTGNGSCRFMVVGVNAAISRITLGANRLVHAVRRAAGAGFGSIQSGAFACTDTVCITADTFPVVSAIRNILISIACEVVAEGRNHSMTADPCATRGAVDTVFHTGFGACSRCTGNGSCRFMVVGVNAAISRITLGADRLVHAVRRAAGAGFGSVYLCACTCADTVFGTTATFLIMSAFGNMLVSAAEVVAERRNRIRLGVGFGCAVKGHRGRIGYAARSSTGRCRCRRCHGCSLHAGMTAVSCTGIGRRNSITAAGLRSPCPGRGSTPTVVAAVDRTIGGITF